ncbi:hypothetical protein [Helicobacter pylori]|uniref:hypothetical protein n=1 Tax=Helicobacter pylori TaxID=210 RepID=UPI001ABA0C6E|nr:hypothetical protein [Helicobacter pylori]WRE17021.1 hypothetical protein KVC61_00240 [Helicobacter pylori]
MRKLTTKGFYGGCYKKSELDIDDKKALEIESEAHTKPLLMAQSLFEAKAITISQLPLA